MLWMGGSRTLHEYVQLACGADPQMLPTLLGLRLMNDPQVWFGLDMRTGQPHAALTADAHCLSTPAGLLCRCPEVPPPATLYCCSTAWSCLTTSWLPMARPISMTGWSGHPPRCSRPPCRLLQVGSLLCERCWWKAAAAGAGAGCLAMRPLPHCPPMLGILFAGSDGISSTLQAWGDLGTRRKRLPVTDRSGLRLGSQLTLLHLVAGLAGRVRGLLPPGEPAVDCTAGAAGACLHGWAACHNTAKSCCPCFPCCEGPATWRHLAASLAAACGIEDSYRLQLAALCCWAVQRPGQEGSPGQAPLLVSGRVTPSAEYRRAAKQGHTPLLGLQLVELPRGATSIFELLAEAGAGRVGQHVRMFDVLSFDVQKEEASCHQLLAASC